MFKLLALFVFALHVVAADSGTDSLSSMGADPFDALRLAQAARTRHAAAENAAGEQRFVASFNKLAQALDDFSKAYKAKHVIDVRKIKCIRDAYRRLEQTDPWFRAQ